MIIQGLSHCLKTNKTTHALWRWGREGEGGREREGRRKKEAEMEGG